MGGGDAGPTYDPERARRALDALTRGDEPHGVRDAIAASWRRSLAHGVARDVLSTPYDERALDPGFLLVRAAEPVLDQLRTDLADSPSCVTLVDRHGRIARRATGDPRLNDLLDAALAAPGFNYSERYVGTNALGMALHDRRVVVVHEREHFSDQLAGVSGSAAPVRDPVTGRILGAVGIAAPATHGGSWAALVRQTALLVEERLFDLQADGQRALYGAYLAALRRGRDRVFAVGPDLLRATPEVRPQLAGLDHDQLWAQVVDALASREEAEVPLTLADERVVVVRLRAFEQRGRLVGALGELRPADEQRLRPQPARSVLPLREYAGWSMPVRAAAVALLRLGEERRPACVAGEPGTGKATMVELVARRVQPGRALVTVDGAADTVCVEQVFAHLAAGGPVLVRHAERLDVGTLDDLLLRTDHGSAARGWLALTWRGDPEALTVGSDGLPLRVLTLPPLRARPQDVPRAVDRMLRARPEGRDVAFTPALLERLRRQPWPTNLTGLASVVDELLEGRRGRVVHAGALDEIVAAGVRRRLTPVEWLLRSAIVDALQSHGGNKELAAASLGMSRASIYRKIKSLEIDADNLGRG